MSLIPPKVRTMTTNYFIMNGKMFPPFVLEGLPLDDLTHYDQPLFVKRMSLDELTRYEQQLHAFECSMQPPQYELFTTKTKPVSTSAKLAFLDEWIKYRGDRVIAPLPLDFSLSDDSLLHSLKQHRMKEKRVLQDHLSKLKQELGVLEAANASKTKKKNVLFGIRKTTQTIRFLTESGSERVPDGVAIYPNFTESLDMPPWRRWIFEWAKRGVPISIPATAPKEDYDVKVDQILFASIQSKPDNLLLCVLVFEATQVLDLDDVLDDHFKECVDTKILHFPMAQPCKTPPSLVRTTIRYMKVEFVASCNGTVLPLSKVHQGNGFYSQCHIVYQC